VPHTPDLHATTVHPDPPAAPHPDGPTGSHGEGAPPDEPVAAGSHDPGRVAVVRDERGNVEGVPGDPAQTLRRRVELGFPDTLRDPRASPLFPPGYDPLHGHSVDQAIHDMSDGSYPDGSLKWDYANQAPDGGKIIGYSRYPVSHDPLLTDVTIDRFGSPGGKFASPEGLPYPSRGLHRIWLERNTTSIGSLGISGQPGRDQLHRESILRKPRTPARNPIYLLEVNI